MKNKSLTKSQTLEQGAAWLFISTILAKIISAAFKIPLSSEYCLGDLGFGYFSSVHDLVGPIHVLAVSGFPVVVSRLIAENIAVGDYKTAAKVFKTSKYLIGAIAVCFGLAVLLFSYPFVKLTDETGQTIYSMIAMIPSACCCIFASVYRGYYEGIQNMVPPAISSLIEAVGKLLLGFSFAYLTVKLTQNTALGAAAALLGIAVGEIVSLIFLFITKKYLGTSLNTQISGYREKYDKGLAKKIIILALPIALASVSGNIVSVIDAITVRTQLYKTVVEFPNIINSMFGSAFEDFFAVNGNALSAEEIPTFLYGIKSKAWTIYNLIPTIVATLGVAAVPKVAIAFKNRNTDELKKATESVMSLSVFTAVPACFGLFVLSKPIFSLLYGGSDSVALIGGKMLEVFAVSALFSALSIVSGSILQAANMQNRIFFNVAIGVVIKIILNLSLSAVPALNIYGSVYATLICFIVIFILNLAVLVKITGVGRKLWGISLKITAASCISAVVARLVAGLSDDRFITVFAILCAVIIYLILIAVFKAFNLAELTRLIAGREEKQG